MKSRFVAFLICACMVTLVAAPAAVAVSATEDAYVGLAGREDIDAKQDAFGGQAAQAAQEDADGESLAFTGFELPLVVLAGVALVGGGLAVRRFSRDPAGA